MQDLSLFDGDELLALIRYDIEANRLEAALYKIKYALNLENYPNALYSVAARVYAQIGLYDRAKPLYLSYIEANPDCVTEKFQLGMTESDAGNSESALSVWKDLLSEHPTHPPALYFSAAATAKTGNIDDCRRFIDILLKSAPVDNLYFERGKELLASINGDPAQA